VKLERAHIKAVDPATEDGEPGPYDAGPAEEDLWFLPGPDPEQDEDPFAPPLPKARRTSLFDPVEWRAAEAALTHELSDLAVDLGRLAERAAVMGPSAAERLAQAEAASLSWWTGDRIPPDRIALWISLRIGATGDDSAALIRTAWASRRLAAPQATGQGRAARIAAHLGLDAAPPSDLIEDLASLLPQPGELGAVATGCAIFHLWRALEERPAHLRDIEAAVLGARLGLGIEDQALGFLPLSLAGMRALTVSGPPERKLAGWIAGAHNAVLSALMTLERLRRWRSQAEAGTGDLSGRTPRLLIEGLLRRPMVAVPQLVAETGASRQAVLRNLAIFEDRGLVREVTGHGRFRVWTAKL